MATSTFNMIVGRGGKSLRDKWAEEGTKTFLGLHSHGFPNMFIVSGPQGGGGQFNFTRTIESHTDYVVWMLEQMRERDANTLDIKKEAEVAYAEHCKEVDIRTAAFRDCMSYYNGEGNAQPGSLAYYGGPDKWHQLRTAARETMEPYVFGQ